ncbi:hypothetical protein MBAV_000042 [Candidatus Magnetobacterium bavaricum]|uniref:Uncharacterized protein n=1 Tax=Candidatus Magnetobacterium bavaricum TaxID=29290 RepID=A0A0F3H0W7_9BACT|nr:hypothetical protein MBAV_000042 [Candidatus Magnetobacterium bavaricum]
MSSLSVLLTNSSRSLPILKPTDLLAGTSIGSPVLGLRAFLALWSLTTKEPNPLIVNLLFSISPFLASSVNISIVSLCIALGFFVLSLGESSMLIDSSLAASAFVGAYWLLEPDPFWSSSFLASSIAIDIPFTKIPANSRNDPIRASLIITYCGFVFVKYQS